MPFKEFKKELLEKLNDIYQDLDNEQADLTKTTKNISDITNKLETLLSDLEGEEDDSE